MTRRQAFELLLAAARAGPGGDGAWLSRLVAPHKQNGGVGYTQVSILAAHWNS
jgi:hypothetical protein